MKRDFTVYAPAKLNLFLDIKARRPDGYHEIDTVFEKIDLMDRIHIRPTLRPGEVNVISSDSRCPSGRDNLVWKAVERLFREVRPGFGVNIEIEKNIPVGAGLGGGSSDAASALLAVNKMCEPGVSPQGLFSIAAGLGKDIPFFLIDSTFARATGLGEELEPIETEATLFHIIICPADSKSTGEMYNTVDSSCDNFGKGRAQPIIDALRMGSIESIEGFLYNIFEAVYSSDARVIKAKELIRSVCTGRKASLSGSGPSVFCILKDRKEGMYLISKIKDVCNESVFLATSYKGGIYGDNRSKDLP